MALHKQENNQSTTLLLKSFIISCVDTSLFHHAKRLRMPHMVSEEANYETSILRDLQIYSAANLAIFGKFIRIIGSTMLKVRTHAFIGFYSVHHTPLTYN